MNSAEIFDIIVKSALTAAGAAIFAACVAFIKNSIKKDRAYDKALKAIAHDSYYRMCRYMLAEPEATEEEMENLNYLYDAYKSLGLNGMGDELYKRCSSKPLRPPSYWTGNE